MSCVFSCLKERERKVKKIIILIIISLITITTYLVNKKETNLISKTNEITNPFEILGENSLALTLNGKPTDLTYSELMNTKLANTITCDNGTTATFNNTDNSITLTNIQIPDYCTIDFKDKAPTLYSELLKDHPTRLTRTDFSTVFTSSNTGTLYTVSGNYTEGAKTVYYFAGNAQDNWVKFGSDSNGNDLYWRIIRTNEDGSVRLLYVGTSMNTTAGYINASQAYNSSYSDPMYVGYMYGTSGSLASNRTNTTNSPIKTTIDTWYNGSINAKTDAAGNKYDKYVSRTAIYCNDRAHEGTYTTGRSRFYYAGDYRLQSGKQPSYKCGNNVSGTLYGNSDNADRFSASTSTTYTNGVNAGNGKLQYPLALMTADEVAFAGGLWATNAPTWYYYNSTGGSVVRDKAWWTMSPYDWVGSHVRVFFVHGSSFPGRLSTDGVSGTNAVRPVLSLKSCTSWVSGDGSVNNPYEVTIDNTCASREN
jgi:hypothetical protein